MTIQIRVGDTAYQDKLITVNRQKFFITLTFNTRDDRWYFDLRDRNGNDILKGVKILPEQDLTGKYLDATIILGGRFFCVDTKGSGGDMVYETFGTDKQFQLWYISDAELEAL